MKTKLIAAMLSAILMTLPGAASAQLGGLGKSLGVGSSGASTSMNASDIITTYVKGAQYVNQADVKMLRAVGLKDEADRLELEAKNLTSGATKDALESASTTQTESSKALESKLSGDKFKMDATSKKQFSEGMADLGRGVIQYVNLAKKAQGYTPGIGDVSAAGSASYVVSSLPGSIKALAASLKSASDFAKSNNIPVPKESVEATSLL